MNAKARALLLEQATSARRPPSPDGDLRPHPAFLDLDAAGRQELHRTLELQRWLEAALDPESLSSTGRAVLARITDGAG